MPLALRRLIQNKLQDCQQHNNRKCSFRAKIQTPLKLLSGKKSQPLVVEEEHEISKRPEYDSDDDQSVSSTVDSVGSVGSSLSDLEEEAEQDVHISPLHADKNNNNKAVKRVRFAPASDNLHYTNTTLYKEEKADLCWYDAADYFQFKQDRRDDLAMLQNIEKEFADSPLSYSKVLERAYDQLCHYAATSLDEDTDDCNIVATQILDDSTLQHLKLWIRRTCVGRLGLERALVAALVQDKVYRRRELTETIMDVQDDHLAVYAQLNDRVSRELQQSSEIFSLPTRLFAQLLGQLQSEVNVYKE